MPMRMTRECNPNAGGVDCISQPALRVDDKCLAHTPCAHPFVSASLPRFWQNLLNCDPLVVLCGNTLGVTFPGIRPIRNHCYQVCPFSSQRLSHLQDMGDAVVLKGVPVPLHALPAQIQAWPHLHIRRALPQSEA